MYVDTNFKTKKAFIKAFKDGDRIKVYSPGFFPAPTDGTCAVEGPHYPAPHTWYASVTIKDSIVTGVK